MNEMTSQELHQRIDSFMSKKHQQFPELALRGEEREPKDIFKPFTQLRSFSGLAK